MLCQFLLYNKVNQLYVYIYIPISPPSCVSLPPSLSHPSKWSQSTELIYLCDVAASHQLSILHLVVYICQCYSLTSSQLTLHPSHVLKSVLYVCIFIPVLPLGFSEPFFLKEFLYFLKLFIYLFIYLWLCWVFVSVRGLSPVAASGSHSSSRCTGLSLSRPLLLRGTGSRHAGPVVVAHGPSCSTACGIFPDKCSNPCPLHWQADSQPLRHQGSLQNHIFFQIRYICVSIWYLFCSF